MDIEKMFDADEKPLDNILSDGGFSAIFRTVCCVGDSLSSGEFEARDDDGKTVGYDMFDYSWGQYIARTNGAKVYNFSRGGMTAEEYCRTFADENGFWDKDKACQAYIIALGVNDILGCHADGNTDWSINDVCKDDWHKNKENFAGYYAQIIQRLKEISPDAKFFLMTIPNGQFEQRSLDNAARHQKLLYDLCEMFDNCYVLDFRKYAPDYRDKTFKDRFFLYSHMNPMGYILTAKMVMSYIDYIVRHNMDSFRRVGFICSSAEYKY